MEAIEAITVPGTIDSLARIREYIDSAATSAGLEKKASYRLRLAVDEIATNIITHGYEEAGIQGELRLAAEIDESALTICLEDTGDPYDPTEASGPDDLDQPLEDRNIGGLGIYLTVIGVDEFAYERVEDRNRNVFIMHRPQEPQTQGPT